MKTPPAPTAVLIAIVTLTLAAIALVAADASRAGSQAATAREFQQLVRGLGLGPKLTLSRCQCAFDLRLHPNWRAAHAPVACGEYFCPHHAGSVLYLAPKGTAPSNRETATDAEGR